MMNEGLAFLSIAESFGGPSVEGSLHPFRARFRTGRRDPPEEPIPPEADHRGPAGLAGHRAQPQRWSRVARPPPTRDTAIRELRQGRVLLQASADTCRMSASSRPCTGWRHPGIDAR